MKTKYSILYVDDEESNLRTFSNLFRRNYKIFIARSGEEGLKILEENQVDAVITDQRMPEMTGVEFLQEVLKKYPEPNRILLTGFSDFQAIKEAINTGKIFQYVQKPWEIDELKPIIDKAIEAYYLKKENQKLQNELKEKNDYLNDSNSKLEEEIAHKNQALEELQLSQNELTKSEKRFRDISFSIADWIWEVDLQGTFLHSTGKVKEIIGYDGNELIGKSIFDLLYPEDVSRIKDIIEKYSKSQEPITDLEICHVKKDGGKVCLLTNGVPLYNDNNKLIGYRGVNKDITQRKITEQKIIESESRLKEAQTLSRIGNWELNPKTNTLFWSDETYNIFNIDPNKHDITYEAFLETVHPKDREKVNLTYQQHIKNKEEYDLEYRLLLSNNTIKYVHEKYKSVFETDGNIILSKGTIQDVTEKKLAEIELNKHKERLEELVIERTKELELERDRAQMYLDVAGVIILVLDKNQNIVLINKKGIETLGYNNEKELIGMNWYDNFIPETLREKRRKAFLEIFNENIEHKPYVENIIVSKTGEKKLIAWKDAILRSNENKIIGLLSSGEDITSRRKNEIALKERTKELEMFNKTMIGRELRIIELKEEINALSVQLHKSEPYPTIWEKSNNLT